MSSQIDVNITLEGNKSISPFTRVYIHQCVNEMSTFEIYFPMDVIESGSSFVLNESKKYLGRSVLINFKNRPAEGTSEPIIENNFTGIVTSVKLANTGGFLSDLVFSGYCPLIYLKSGPNLRCFAQSRLKNIVNQVLESVPSNISRTINPRYTDEILYSTQYNENDIDYLRRLANEYGEWFYYNGSKIIFGDPIDEEPVAIDYLRDSNNILLSLGITDMKHDVYSYDYFKKEIVLSSAPSSIAGADPMSSHAHSRSNQTFVNKTLTSTHRFIKTKQELDKEIEARAYTQAASFLSLHADTVLSHLKLGSIVTVSLNNVVGDNSNDAGHFRIVKISHTSDGLGNYQNTIQGIPKEMKVPANIYEPIHWPVAAEQPAIVVDNNDPEKLGRIKVRLMWQSNSSNTPWIRMSMPNAGGNKGIYFLPEIDEEVLVGFENGNPDLPYVIGSMHNGKDKSEWHDDDNYKKAIHTMSGNVILFNDEAGKEAISIYNKDKKTEITLTLKGDGNILIHADKEIKFDSEKILFECKELKINAQDKIESTTKEHKINCNQNLKVEAGQNIECQAGSNYRIEAGSNVENTAGSEYKITAGVKIEAQSGGTAKIASGAKLDIQAGAVAAMKAPLIQLN
jgi:uncharacterized protein involved in type VI secretion and phage assembly